MEKIKKYLLSSMVMVMMLTISFGTLPGTQSDITVVYADQTVYITRTGSKYHTHKCGNGTYYETTLSNAKARGLTPCKKCYGSNYTESSSSGGNSSSDVKKPNIKISKASKTLIVGQSVKLKITGTSSKVEWKSNHKKIADVTSNGKVTAKKKGNAVITAVVGNVTKKCKIKVESPQISRTSITMEEGEYADLYLKGCSHEAEWSSSDSDIVDVYDGELEAYEPGSVVIKAKVHGKTFTCSVTVTDTASEYDDSSNFFEQEY